MSTATELHDSCAYIAEELENAYDSGDMTDWLCENELDEDLTISRDGSILSTSIYVTLGGPTIWVDTGSATVDGTWGTDRASVCASRSACLELERTIAECMYGVEVHA